MNNKEAIEFLMLHSLEYRPRTFEYTSLNKIIELLRENEPKKGKWIVEEGNIFNSYICSNCKEIGASDYKFCPNCGSDNREEDNE